VPLRRFVNQLMLKVDDAKNVLYLPISGQTGFG